MRERLTRIWDESLSVRAPRPGSCRKSDDMASTTEAKPGTLQITRSPGTPVAFTFSGELNAASLRDLWPQMIAAIRDGSPKQISVDTAAVSYCDGSGLGLIAELRREAKAHQIELKFIGGASDLLSLIEMSALPDASAPQLGRPPHVGLIERSARPPSTSSSNFAR